MTTEDPMLLDPSATTLQAATPPAQDSCPQVLQGATTTTQEPLPEEPEAAPVENIVWEDLEPDVPGTKTILYTCLELIKAKHNARAWRHATLDGRFHEGERGWGEWLLQAARAFKAA
ncbi:hypothetical protein E2562_022538 [Oryza meyeriana var. granulata]|uniref:Uncharacterized protein n=1 Tax=Oryza meyeriana var. granulata TaxID=110450 RepID=A0A6G1FAX5_9ORYZ|nr:hypothetical protein E2562_022538 [Oryza meyeriana var. granulata]